jgi:hypothetical protein
MAVYVSGTVVICITLVVVINAYEILLWIHRRRLEDNITRSSGKN